MRKFLAAVDKVRVVYPLLWEGSKRNRRIEVSYWLVLWNASH